MKKKTYWYLFHHNFCVVCGNDCDGTKERIYNRPKPKKWENRHIHKQTTHSSQSYCGCMDKEFI